MASPHISLPKPFATGDAVEWFQRFEICSRANEWNDNKKALKLPTLLEGEALAVWVELTDEEQKDYAATKKKIIDAIMPMQFVSLADFHKRLLLPGESLSMYVHQLKQLLNQAMPDIPAAAKEQLLLHQFLSGLPQEVSKQLRATGTATTLTDAVERAKLLMTIEHREVAATTKHPSSCNCSNSFLIYQNKWRQCLFAHLGSIKDVGKYEDALFATKQDTFSMLVLPNVPDKMHDDALNATNLVIYGKIVCRETRKGWLYGAAAVPTITKPTSNYCGHYKEQGHSNHGRGRKCIC